MASAVTFYNDALTHNGKSKWPWAHRAWLTLLEKKVNFTTIPVPLNNKPQWYKDLYASVHPDPLARAKVPIIEIGKPNDAEYQILVESDVVARFVAELEKNM